MDCEDKEGIMYLKLNKGNNLLHAESNCLVKEEGMHPEFEFRTPANDKYVKFEIENIRATFIDPNNKELNNRITRVNKRMTELVQLQYELNKIKAKHGDNFTTNIYNEQKALNTSHEKN